MITKTAKDLFLSAGILVGTIIGAGIFALPYLFKEFGAGAGFFYLALAAVVYGAVYLMYAEIIRKTPGDHRFVGYAKIWIGKWGELVSIFTSIAQTVLVLTIYLVLSRSFAALFVPFGAGIQKPILFWLIGSAAVFLGVRKIAWLETLITGGLAAIILLIFGLGVSRLGNLSAVNFGVDWQNFLAPLAAVLFSFSGRQAIPTMIKISPDVRKPVFFGLAAVLIIYALFILSVLSLSPVVYPDAVSGLVGGVPGWALAAVGIFGLLSLLSSYVTVGYDIYESLALDLKFPDWLRFSLVVFGPIALYLAGFANFISLIAFTGGIFLSLEGIFIIWMWLKATGRKINAWSFLALLVFAIALVYEVIK